jgi:hypothetical protein
MSVVEAITRQTGALFNISLSACIFAIPCHQLDVDPLRVHTFQEMSHQVFAARAWQVTFLIRLCQKARHVLDFLLMVRVWTEHGCSA